MNEFEKIQRYIDRYNCHGVHGCEITSKELLALASNLSPIDIALWAFTYGRSKGYRAAKAEAKRG